MMKDEIRCRNCHRVIRTEPATRRGLGDVCFSNLVKEKEALEARLFEIICVLGQNHQILPQDGTEVKQDKLSSAIGINRPELFEQLKTL